jgi:hypothetical protein
MVASRLRLDTIRLSGNTTAVGSTVLGDLGVLSPANRIGSRAAVRIAVDNDIVYLHGGEGMVFLELRRAHFGPSSMFNVATITATSNQMTSELWRHGESVLCCYVCSLTFSPLPWVACCSSSLMLGTCSRKRQLFVQPKRVLYRNEHDVKMFSVFPARFDHYYERIWPFDERNSGTVSAFISHVTCIQLCMQFLDTASGGQVLSVLIGKASAPTTKV